MTEGGSITGNLACSDGVDSDGLFATVGSVSRPYPVHFPALKSFAQSSAK